ncbi:helix-turn-helix domain-containing protein [Streptomyces sp. NPDC059788]|uniref:helix-turn-helix domain-containing protein n=1 Tax=Streptomyces sp. NPDC059788 TaxID=3346948 RepID=UPI0036571F43
MPQWSEYSTGQRIKILRGRNLTQTELAEATGLTVDTIARAERDVALTLPTLLAVSAALHADVSVIVGQQAPRRAVTRQDRRVLQTLSRTVHDTAAGILPSTVDEPPTLEELRTITGTAWDQYWAGNYVEAGAVAAPFLQNAVVRLHAQPAGQQAEAWSVLSDAYRISAYVANLLGSRDLAYAAIGHAHKAAEQAADPMRAALVDSGRAWVYLRDARLEDALNLATKAAMDIEPRFSAATPEELVVYGSHVNFAAVVASRKDDGVRAGDFLSQSHAIGTRLGNECRAYGTLFGPVTATTQAVGIKVALGETGTALSLADSIHDVSGLQGAARNRYALDKAMAQADAKMWDSSLETLEEVCREAPEWVRHQALPGVIAEKISLGSTARVRQISELLGVVATPYGQSFAPANRRTAL